jgi:glycosyltransferase involved in cell wall biosynthesis
MNKKIGFLTRKPILGVHYSIENALNQVRNGLLKTGKWEIDWLEMPCYSKGFVPRLKSMFFARYHQKDINHITGDIYFIALFLPGKSLVITIHDILFLYPKRGPTWLVLWFFWIYLPVLKAKVIVAVSEHTKNEILRITRCHATKIKVIPPLISPKFQYFPKIFQKECPIILHVGTAWNKNLVNHIKALRGIPCLLNIVGMLSKSQRLALKKAEINYQNKVQLSEKEMLALYQSSDILLFASLAEGFGLPILEAQSVGRVVITADRGATAEVAGKGALLVNPRAPEDIRKGILAVVNDDVLRAFYISEGFKNRYQYSSKSVTEQYDRVFSSM